MDTSSLIMGVVLLLVFIVPFITIRIVNNKKKNKGTDANAE